MNTVRFATTHEQGGVDVAMLRRRFEAWIADIAVEPPKKDEECTFSIVAHAREAGPPGFSVEVTRSSWRNS